MVYNETKAPLFPNGVRSFFFLYFILFFEPLFVSGNNSKRDAPAK